MKKKIVILLTLAILLTASVSYAAVGDNATGNTVALQKVDFSDATVTASLLNLRDGPATSFPSICKLEIGQTVQVMGKLGDWYVVYESVHGHIGAVDGRYIKSGTEALPASTDVSTPGSNESASDNTGDTADKTAAAITNNLSADEEALFTLVNKARKDAGVGELSVDENLMKIARMKAEDMVKNNYFAHQSPTYGSPFDMMKQFNNSFTTAGENIAGNKTVDGAFKAWMSSDKHKKNILNENFDVTGIGVVSSATYGKVLVQQFIGR